MPTAPNQSAWGHLVIALVVLATVAVGVVAVWNSDPAGDRGNRLSESFQYDLDAHQQIDPKLFTYRQTAEIPLEFETPRAVAVGPDDRTYVAGDRAVHVFDQDGSRRTVFALDGPPQCLAVADQLYVGLGDRVEVYTKNGSRVAQWESLGDRAVLTSIAVADGHVFVADAGEKVVWHFDAEGKRLGAIGRRDPERNIPGFVIPSPYFDIAMAPDGLLRVVNPGGHRIEAFTLRGDLELSWGKPDIGVEGFCGCCNPANMAILPDGRIVTAEKGIARVKVYSVLGDFEGVVCGPETLAAHAATTDETRAPHRPAVVDVATDSQGRVLVLDPAARRVLVFEEREIEN